MQIMVEQGAEVRKTSSTTSLDVARFGKRKAKATYPLNEYSTHYALLLVQLQS